MADPTREDVLAWMRVHGKGAKAAARAFGLNPNTVKSWARKARRDGRLPPAAPQPSRQPPPPSQGDVVAFPGASTPPCSPPVAPPPTKVARNGRVTLSADALDDESAGLLRKAAHRLLLYAAGEPMPELADLTPAQLAALKAADLDDKQLQALDALSGWDPRRVKESMIALGIIVDKCPDILSLGKKTAEKDTDDTADAGNTADAVAAAMGIDA